MKHTLTAFLILFYIVGTSACGEQDKPPPKEENKKGEDTGFYDVYPSGKYIYIMEELAEESILLQYDSDTDQTKKIDLAKITGKKGYFSLSGSLVSGGSGE